MGGIIEYQRFVASGETSSISARGDFIRVKQVDVATPVPITVTQNQLGGKSGESYTSHMAKFEKMRTPTQFDSVVIDCSNVDDFPFGVNISLQIGYGDFQSEVISRTTAAGVLAPFTFCFTAADLAAETNDADGFVSLTAGSAGNLLKRVTVRLHYLKKTAAVFDGSTSLTMLKSFPGLFINSLEDTDPPADNRSQTILSLGDFAANIAPQYEFIAEATSGVRVRCNPTYIDSVIFSIIPEIYSE